MTKRVPTTHVNNKIHDHAIARYTATLHSRSFKIQTPLVSIHSNRRRFRTKRCVRLLLWKLQEGWVQPMARSSFGLLRGPRTIQEVISLCLFKQICLTNATGFFVTNRPARKLVCSDPANHVIRAWTANSAIWNTRLSCKEELYFEGISPCKN